MGNFASAFAIVLLQVAVSEEPPMRKPNWAARILSRGRVAPGYEAQYRSCRKEGLRALARGRVGEAIDALGRAVLFHSQDSEAHFDLGRALFADGKAEAARQAYLRALSLNPTSAEVRRALLELPPIPPGREDFRTGAVLNAPDAEVAFYVWETKKGGFGIVYCVEEWPKGCPFWVDDKGELIDHLDRWALKTFQARYLWSDEDRRRFEREALHWIKLYRHPNIVHAKAVVVIEGFPCLQLEYLPYTLAQLLEAGSLAPRAVLELSLQFCDGMIYAHQKGGLVHRDIKPSNCLLTADKRTLKISDWGLSHALGKAAERSLGLAGLSPQICSQLTTIAGTPRYMAPEQFSVGETLDARTDVYAFGVMFYEMLTKDLPPVGYLAYSHIARVTFPHRIPGNLREIVRLCVRPKPRERPSNFQDVRFLLALAYRELTGEDAPPEAKPPEMTAADWNDSGVSLSRLGYHNEACSSYERALEISPNSATIWMNKGGVLNTLGKSEEALACIERGLQIDPASPSLWKEKGIILQKLGRSEEAAACSIRSLDLQSEDACASYYQWREMAVNLVNTGNFEFALKCCDRGLSNNKSDAGLWCHKAVALGGLDRHEEALVSCEEGLAIEPRNHKLWSIRAFALLRLKRFEEALLSCNRGLEINPDDPYLWENKGASLQSLGRQDEAKECSDRALVLRLFRDPA
jgi:serine/threonine protein kinase